MLVLAAAACDGAQLSRDEGALVGAGILSHECGDGVVGADELCDLAIAAGQPGACPSTCDDAVCSRDVLVAGGSCMARCHHEPITAAADGDGCCPPGATANSDSDCPRGACEDTCGDGDLDPGETCDPGIAAGEPGACPTSCPDDGVACTRDIVDQPGTCQAACAYVPVTEPVDGDGCCPAGANGANDRDCISVCGNAVVEPGEECDDGNNVPGDACHQCRLVATAMRFTSLTLRDPHVKIPFIGCFDITDTSALPVSANGMLAQQMEGDANADGLLDLSPTIAFRPLAQTGTVTAAALHEARCTAPRATTTCSPAATPTVTTATNGSCLGVVPGTTRPYLPGITAPAAPCFTTAAQPLTLTLLGATVPLERAQVSATYVGNPATTLSNGLVRGFLPESVANTILLPADLPAVGGRPLASLLPGGRGACDTRSDRDIVDGVPGWWFYFNYSAARVPWTE